MKNKFFPHTMSLFDEQEKSEHDTPSDTTSPVIPYRAVHDDLAPLLERMHDADRDLDPSTCRFVLAHPDVENYLLKLRTSQLFPLFKLHAGNFLTVPASAASRDNFHRTHDNHPHGLLMHTARAFRSAMRLFDVRMQDAAIGGRMIESSCNPDTLLDAITLHDFAKTHKYARVPETLTYVHTGLPLPVSDPAWTMKLLAEAHITLDARLTLALWYQDPNARQNMIEDDLIRLITQGDTNAVDDIRIREKQWKGLAKKCSNCNGLMSLVLPRLEIAHHINTIRCEFRGEAKYICQERSRKCEKPVEAGSLFREEREAFDAWIRQEFPHSSPL